MQQRAKSLRILRVVLLTVFLLLNISALQAAPITGIVSFGDSLSDTGNLFTLTSVGGRPGFPSSPPYDNGRFSNGPIWLEVLADGLRVDGPAPSFLGGSNYAWGGAETGVGISAQGTPNIGPQIDTFLKGNTPAEGQLMVIWAGSNDFNNAASPPNPADLVQNISNHIQTLAAAAPAGTNLDFLIPNMVPLGQTVRAQWLGENVDPAIPIGLDAISAAFNAQLTAELNNLMANLGVTIFELDVFSIAQHIISDPAASGFTNVRDTARTDLDSMGRPPNVTTPGTGVVLNPDEYVFFDDVHPTSAFHEIVGNEALELVTHPVPVPATVILLFSGILGVMGLKKLRKG